MKVLLDENIDKKLKDMLFDLECQCQTATDAGYRGKKSGERWRSLMVSMTYS